MAQVMLQAEGKTKKQAARELSRHINLAREMNLYKDGRTAYMAKDGKILAVCCVHS